jgi:hypothetical protein
MSEQAPLPTDLIPDPGMDPTDAPDWWLTKPDEIRAFLDSLDGVTVRELGRTAGDRPIIVAEWGEREDLPERTSESLPSSIASGQLESFYGTGEREKQHILFLGAAHGTEWDGTVAAMHLLNILVHGTDLRGRKHPEMAERARQYRWCVIPFQNVDGRQRLADHRHWIGVDPDYFMALSQGVRHNGEIFHWPRMKAYFPVPKEEFAFMGSYFNDNGVNLVYDVCMGPDMQPENVCLWRYAREERPDLVILSHSNHGSLALPPAAYVPDNFRMRLFQLGACLGMRCKKEGYVKQNMTSRPVGYAGQLFYQSDMMYHAFGALPIEIEFPSGWKSIPPTHDDLLDIGLAVLDELAVFGTRWPFRPPNLKR